ncbi:MAG: hypothetical protein KGZ83_01660 [Sulfuricella sp.]|nr:hypothetical protein [Sulfuricella sp.]
MSISNLVAAPINTPFCSTCLHWEGSRELKSGYCITPLMAEGNCVRTADGLDDPSWQPYLKPAREYGCEFWRGMEFGREFGGLNA